MHPREYVDAVHETCARGGAFDMDTPASPGSWEAALRAAGGACALAELLLRGDELIGFSGLRPPGHHAEAARAMGFCLLANVSIAARHALALGASRVLILDWDVHHGNGTNSIFHESPRCSSRASTSTRSIPAPGRWRTSARAQARASRSTSPCRAALARKSSAG